MRIAGDGVICWTLVKGGGKADIRSKLAAGDESAVGVVVCATPVLDVVNPALTTFGRFNFGVVVDQEISEIIAVEHPTQRELAQITRASDGLSLALGLGKGGQ